MLEKPETHTLNNFFKIQQITFTFNNEQIIKQLEKRGGFLKEADFIEAKKVEAEIDQEYSIEELDDEDSQIN